MRSASVRIIVIILSYGLLFFCADDPLYSAAMMRVAAAIEGGAANPEAIYHTWRPSKNKQTCFSTSRNKVLGYKETKEPVMR